MVLGGQKMSSDYLTSICVFCGSSSGNDPKYEKLAMELGMVLVNNGIRLIYGGGKTGLMGKMASVFVENGARVTGVLPRGWDCVKDDLVNIVEVHSIEERKAIIYAVSDAAIALPGGVGTAEEIFYVLSHMQFGADDPHRYPFRLGLLDTDDSLPHYGPIVKFLRDAAKREFMPKELLEQIVAGSDPEAMVREVMANYTKPAKCPDKLAWALSRHREE